MDARRASRALLPPDAAATLHFDAAAGRCVLFAAVLAVGTGLLFGMFPALHSTRSDLVTAIRAGAGPDRRRAERGAVPRPRS